MKRMGWALALALPLLGGPVLADDEKGEHHHDSVKMEDLPAAVQDTLRKESAGGKIEELSKEKRKGEVIYEAEIIKNGMESELEIDSSGEVVDRGKEHRSHEEHEQGEK
jgi:uncharacterized membrane protein YkoI